MLGITHFPRKINGKQKQNSRPVQRTKEQEISMLPAFQRVTNE
jgi:hypothetical protein